MTTTIDTLLAVTNITKRFGETVALNDVSLELFQGEVHCLVGENGAGKSTLIKILAGAEDPDYGTVTIGDQDFEHLEPATAMELGVATIYQDVELISSLTVAENMFLGREIKRFGGVLDFRRQEREARSLMDELNIDIPERAVADTLSPADQQTLQIVKAMGRDASIMIMDEPTSSLGYQEVRALMKLIDGLRRRGLGIIYISHHLEEVFEIGDRVTVLKDGRVVSTTKCSDTTREAVTAAMVGRESSAFYRRERGTPGEVVVEMEGLSKHGLFEDCSFTARAGEVFGIGGMVGAGRSELVRCLYGDIHPDEGTMSLHGRKYKPRNPKHAIRSGIGFVGEDRHIQGLFAKRPVLENLNVIRNESLVLLDGRAERKAATEVAGRINLVMAGLDQPAGSLSGGNQQKTIVGRWLLSQFDVIVLDEPTKGVDVGAKSQIYELISSLVAEGKTVIMVSSDMPELISMSDRIAVMRQGRLVRIIEAEQAEEQELLSEYLGVNESEEQD